MRRIGRIMWRAWQASASMPLLRRAGLALASHLGLHERVVRAMAGGSRRFDARWRPGSLPALPPAPPIAATAFVTTTVALSSPVEGRFAVSPQADHVVVRCAGDADRGTGLTVTADYYDADATRAGAFIKTHPHLYAPRAALIIWYDADRDPQDAAEALAGFAASGAPVATARRRASSNRAVADTGLVMLRMDHKETAPLLAQWWQEIEEGAPDTDAALGRAAEKLAIKLTDIGQLTATPPAVPPADLPALPARSGPAQSIDIIVCVHNALTVTRACLESVAAARDESRHGIIIVDDGSDETTAEALRQFAARHVHCALVRNEAAEGYTRAANLGLRSSAADFMVLLNSDTEVAPGFADKLARAVNRTEGAGIVGPLSNAASAQSLPHVQGDGTQTAINTLPPDWTVAQMDQWCVATSTSPLPRVGIVHGFCLGLTRAALETIGLFDEVNFPRGYGEETDFCMRAANAGIGLVIATDTYVFHHKTQSYDPGVRSTLAEMGAISLFRLHGEARIRRHRLNAKANPMLKQMREAAHLLYR